MFFAQPVLEDVMQGLIYAKWNSDIAIGIIATVMPHYL
jgi:hypothetical protein